MDTSNPNPSPREGAGLPWARPGTNRDPSAVATAPEQESQNVARWYKHPALAEAFANKARIATALEMLEGKSANLEAVLSEFGSGSVPELLKLRSDLEQLKNLLDVDLGTRLGLLGAQLKKLQELQHELTGQVQARPKLLSPRKPRLSVPTTKRKTKGALSDGTKPR